ncbi:lysine transporter LysE [Photobacterium gaetbulicola]|uniref:Translocator protein, LysE family n=1 Tax=Photobacterium gaetbulicola Gung47 TaxID=658445 RepID=A0A0C5WD98_9GAMM|nr:LysE family transporter [Photobacterium gaetbulicola]AJR05068.1 translocator protein, LysE family [Photobacterium gaetbulicola Gung47]PSU06902.1 lysine transporter LysE [Photobacterium gaetbulicola]
MEVLLVLAHVALIWILAVATPGANVLLTINTALQYNRTLAMFSAFGVSTAILLWAFLGGSGLVILLTTFPQLFSVMKVVGGSYLLYLGLRQIYQTRKTKRLGQLPRGQQIISPSNKKVFITAFITSILNPKTGFFVVSLFSVAMPQSMPGSVSGAMTTTMILAIMLTMSSITLCWHSLLATAFSHQSAKSVYARISGVIDYITGGLFTVFGIKVMASS